MDEPNLPQLLTAAKRWFDGALLTGMREAGEQPVTAAQATVFAHLDPDGTSIAELARRVGTARQSTHQAVHALIAAGLLEQVPDPASARTRLVRRTAEGERAHRRALRTIARAEESLAQRLGHDAFAALRDTLARPWGEPPVLRDD